MQPGLTGPAERAPDVAGVVVGWRCWRVDDTAAAPLLRSPVHVRTAWPAGGALTARCELRGHPAPDPSCTCGVYAAREPGRVGGAGFGPGTVLGCVALWGTVVEGEHGWRAGAAAPLVLFCGPSLGEAGRAGLAAAYRVGVHRLAAPVVAAVDAPPPAGTADAVLAAAVSGRGLGEAVTAFAAAARPAPAPAPRRSPARRRRFALGTAAVLAVLAAAATGPEPESSPAAPPGTPTAGPVAR
ncbi:hypothetical protein [Pseudonocardia spirodelae]|uniref:Uncharacterized protein n=1 Tax=Pseudonocardia spirodelae TaxID=3133431 RepID=A0ABU8T1Q9_9PSEU